MEVPPGLINSLLGHKTHPGLAQVYFCPVLERAFICFSPEYVHIYTVYIAMYICTCKHTALSIYALKYSNGVSHRKERSYHLKNTPQALGLQNLLWMILIISALETLRTLVLLLYLIF